MMKNINRDIRRKIYFALNDKLSNQLDVKINDIVLSDLWNRLREATKTRTGGVTLFGGMWR